MSHDPAINLSNLSSEDRELLAYLLEDEGIVLPSPRQIPRRDSEAPPPLSFTQQRMWFIHQLAPHSAAYNLFTAVRLSGQLNFTALHDSFNEIVRRHDILRTTLHDEGALVQRVAPSLTLALPLVDLRHLPETEREVQVNRLANLEAQKPFDMARGPLIRVNAWRLAETEHVILLVLHHIVSDAWSLPIFVQELTALYQAFAKSLPSPLPELPVQFADFAVWQRHWLQGEMLAAELAYWTQRLAGAPPVLTLPTDRPRPSAQTYRGASASFLLSNELSQALRALSQKEDSTLAMTLLASFFVLLHRYTGQTDIVISNGISNRNQGEIEALIGPFVNILLMRADLSGDPSFNELLRQVRRLSVEAIEHQDLPFEKLVEVLQPQRDPSYGPLAQVMFVLHNTPKASASLPDLTLTLMPLDTTAAQYDLLMRVEDTGSGLYGRIEFNTDLFDPPTIVRLRESWLRLLEEIVADPARQLWQLPLLSADEQRQLLVTWNATEMPYPQAQCLHHLFEAHAAESPGAVAVLFEGMPITYGELNRRANQLAHHLQRLGVGPDVRVGLCVERSVEMVVGLLGIAKAGGAYVPLDAMYPPERLAFMVADAQMPVLITQSRLLPGLPHTEAAHVCLDSDWDAIARAGEANPVSAVTADNLIYVIYTSGSTGRPKGVMLDHRGRVNNFCDFNRRFQVRSGDRLLALASLSFDMCAYDVFGALAAGAAVVLPSASHERDPLAWAELIVRHRVTLWHSVPAMLALLVETVDDRPDLCLESLRLVLLGGDWIPVSLPDRIKALAAGVQVISLGGATEASMDSTLYPIQATDPAWRSIPYGRPMANQLAFVLDEHLQPVPIGVAGDLYLGGLGLARGYLNRADLTAAKFVPMPSGAAPGARLYQTGDLARYFPDGNLELLGRIDDQVKVRGFRIDLGEIVAALRQHPSVHDAVVVSRADKPGEPALIGYVVGQPGAMCNAGELRNALKEKLPEYMIPLAVIVLDAFPLTPNGKLDRRALPAPDFARPDTRADTIAPANELEMRLVQVWSELLGIPHIGVTDNFFDLGGDSFKAIRLIRKLDERISLLEVFKHPTVRELAARMSTARPIDAALLQPLKRPVHPPRLSLVCAPYDGGAVVIYRALAQALPADYALYAIALPGHDYDRQDETLRTIEEVAELCVEEIKLKVSGPLAIYGHSGGVALAVELAKQLEAQNLEIQTVFLAGALPGTKRSLQGRGLVAQIVQALRPMTDEALLAYLQSLGAYADFESPTELKLMLKCARHDGRLSAEYFRRALGRGRPARLKAPLVCIVADKDHLTQGYETRYTEWMAFSPRVSLAVINDHDHFFVKSRAKEVADIIVQIGSATPSEPHTLD